MSGLRFFILFTVSFFALSTYADRDRKFAVGAKLGSQGIGVEISTPITKKFIARLGLNGFVYNKNLNNHEIKYKGKIQAFSIPLMIDYHPFSTGFRLSAGIANNHNMVIGEFEPSGNVTLGGITYTANQTGKVSTDFVPKNKMAPIISVGYDNAFFNHSSLSFNCEFGAMLSGKYKVSVSSEGGLTNSARERLIKDLAKDGEKTFSKFKKYLQIYPIASVGVKYSF